MRKTVCIKTNNKEILVYLLEELEYFELPNTYVSCLNFRFYNNIIIHYVGKHIETFLKKISTLLAYTVIDFYEPLIIKNLINSNYFYFSLEERQEIYNQCVSNIDFSASILSLNIISDSFFEYFSNNKYIILDGFVNFKLKEYTKQLDSMVDLNVNKFIVDREYTEFINLLKGYIQASPYGTDVLHLVYKNHEAILLDANKSIIQFNNDLINKKYFSDITFSSNDFALNSLLTLLPKKLYIHLLCEEDDFINTLKLVFDNRIFVCTDCDLCNLYKHKKIKTF